LEEDLNIRYVSREGLLLIKAHEIFFYHGFFSVALAPSSARESCTSVIVVAACSGQLCVESCGPAIVRPDTNSVPLPRIVDAVFRCMAYCPKVKLAATVQHVSGMDPNIDVQVAYNLFYDIKLRVLDEKYPLVKMVTSRDPLYITSAIKSMLR